MTSYSYDATQGNALVSTIDPKTQVTSIDPNKHVAVSDLDALGRTVYTQQDSGAYGGTLTVNRLTTTAYNALNEATSVQVSDKAPQSGQSITSVTTSMQYDDLGRLTQLSDPDRGTHSYSYDPDGRVIADVSGTRTIGTVYDLLGRVGCVQDASPSSSPTGAFTNAAGGAALKGNQLFGPYGSGRYYGGNINTAKGFIGQYNDGLTRLDYFQARYYDPVVGVFLSADTAQKSMAVTPQP